jgi:hypothetical protein
MGFKSSAIFHTFCGDWRAVDLYWKLVWKLRNSFKSMQCNFPRSNSMQHEGIGLTNQSVSVFPPRHLKLLRASWFGVLAHNFNFKRKEKEKETKLK